MRTWILLLAVFGCAPELANVTRMMAAPPREAGCALEFVQASIMDLSPMGKYDILGYVTVSQLAAADPYAEENRKIVRPKACELGGKSVSIMLSSTSTGAFGAQASGTVYAVLREKSTAPAAPQAF